MITFFRGDTELYGKKVSDLQSGVTADRDGILHGTLHYVKNYTEFSGVPAEQNGNYLAMSINAAEDEEVKYESSTSGTGEKTMPKGDRVLVWKVQNSEATMTISITGGKKDRKRVYKASGLVLEKEGK